LLIEFLYSQDVMVVIGFDSHVSTSRDSCYGTNWHSQLLFMVWSCRQWHW